MRLSTLTPKTKTKDATNDVTRATAILHQITNHPLMKVRAMNL
jgi:hypothetical protein